MLFLLVFSSILILILLLSTYKLSGGFFTLPFLVMVYIVLLYIGSIHFFLESTHSTFIFVTGMGFCFLFGIFLADNNISGRLLNCRSHRIHIYNPFNKQIIRIAVISAFMIALSVSCYRFIVFGSPLIKGTIYGAGIEAVSGVTNKLIFVFGPPSLLLLSIFFYALYRAEQDRIYIRFVAISFLSYLVFMLLRGGKSTAIMPFVLLFMLIHYSGYKIPKKVFLSGVVIGITIATVIGGFRLRVFSVTDIATLYYNRMTSIASLHLDYVLTEWRMHNSFQYGGTLLLELKRILAQISPIPKEPLYDQMISNMRRGFPISNMSGLSPEVTFFGMSYVNFGIVGACFFTVLLGFFIQSIHKYLLVKPKMSFMFFSLTVFFMYHMLGGIIRRGNIIITIQTYLLYILAPIIVIGIIYTVLYLPYSSTIKGYKNPSDI